MISRLRSWLDEEPPTDPATLALQARTLPGTALLTAGLGVVGILLVVLLPAPGADGVAWLEMAAGLLACGALAGTVALPWPRWVGTPKACRAARAQHALVALGVAIVIVRAPQSSGVPVLLLLPQVLASASACTPRRHLATSAMCLAVLVGAVSLSPPPAADRAEVALVLVVFAVATVVTSASLVYRHRAARQAEAAVDRLEAVASATPTLAGLTPDAIFSRVVAASVSLGYDVAGISVEQPDGEFRLVASHGVPEELRTRAADNNRGVAGEVFEHRRTAVVRDYPNQRRPIEHWVDDGLRCAIGTPIFAAGEMVGALVCGSRKQIDFDRHDEQAIEILAAHAGRGLELASRLADAEHDLEALRVVDERRATLLTSVSHELRTPLSVVVGVSDTLVAYADRMTDEQRRHLGRRLQANGVALLNVVDGLLDLASIERGTMKLQVGRVDLQLLLAGLMDRLQPLLHGHAATVHVGEGCEVVADPRLLERVLENLVTNGLRHGGRDAGLVLVGRREGDDVVVEVVDDGDGMSAERAAEVASGPVRSEHPEGSGIGLGLVREILRMHGSALEVESTIGAGSTFRFRLAAADGDVAAQLLRPTIVLGEHVTPTAPGTDAARP